MRAVPTRRQSRDRFLFAMDYYSYIPVVIVVFSLSLEGLLDGVGEGNRDEDDGK